MKPLSRKKHIEQIGIDIRQSGYDQEMKAYIEILREEIKITQRFLHECSAGERKFERLIEEEFSDEQKKLAKKSGTPAEFALEIYKLVPDTISMDEADAAIQKYRCEFHDAGQNYKENTVDRPRVAAAMPSQMFVCPFCGELPRLVKRIEWTDLERIVLKWNHRS